MLYPVLSGSLMARITYLEKYAALWRGQWQSQTYPKNSVVNDNGWLMIANKETSAQAAPQDVGSPVFDLPDTPAWAESTYSGLVLSGHEYTLTKPGYIKRIDVWAPEVSAQSTYRVLLIDYQDPANPKITSIADPALVAEQWSTISVGQLPFPAGAVIGVFLEKYSASGATPVNGTWARQVNHNTNAPASGSWVTRESLADLRIHKTDANSIDRSAELASIGAGSTFHIETGGNADQYYNFQATGPAQDNGTYLQWDVNLVSTGPSGAPAVGVNSTLNITAPVFISTAYKQIAGHWPANQPDFATVVGKLTFDGAPQATDNDAFGVRVEFQEAAVSPDWDFMAFTD